MCVCVLKRMAQNNDGDRWMVVVNDDDDRRMGVVNGDGSRHIMVVNDDCGICWVILRW